VVVPWSSSELADRVLPDTLNGLPLHPLAVHGPVVLIPLAALLGVTFAIPALRQWSRWPLALVSLGAAVAAFIAVQSGKNLKESLSLSGPLKELIERHEERAEQLLWMIVAYAALAVIAAVVAGRGKIRDEVPGDHRAASTAPRGSLGVLGVVLSVLLVLGGAAVTYQTYRVGELGSEAVWGSTG
jgi:hypothetical protein